MSIDFPLFFFLSIFFFIFVFFFLKPKKKLKETSGDLGDLRVKDLPPTTESMICGSRISAFASSPLYLIFEFWSELAAALR